ncbi:MAG: SUMF1/EgtB/PvdO family nonheme iron enzyme [Verrucomicrobiota bacterium]
MTVAHPGTTAAILSTLVMSSGALSPTFSATTTNYTTSVSYATTSITVTSTVTAGTATIKVNGTTVASGAASGAIPLAVGTNTITTVVTGSDGTNTYTVAVTRLAPSTVATLSGLALSSGSLSPAFATGMSTYTANVPNATSSITVTPSVTDATATVKANGTTVASGTASQAIPLVAGANTITTVVTAQDGSTTSTYTVTVTRASLNNFTYTSALDVPVTSAGYVATGNVLNLTLGFTPATGTDLMVVKNTGLGFITGQFSNLTQGQVVNLAYNGVTYKYVANYYGGTGNDLVLHWAYQDLVTWGYNSFGQLGNNSFTDSGVPVLATQSGVLAGKTVVSVSAGIWYCLALCSDGTVAAWGDDLEGELGNNRATNSSVPVLVTQSGALAGKTVIAVDTCGWHSLALCSDGTVAAWGANTLGQLGNGSTTNSSVPVLVNQSGVLAGKTVVQIAAGADFNLALCSDGSLATWGYDTTTQHNVPVLVTQSGVLAGKAVVSISGGRCHSLALCSDGTLVAWGYGWSGQLGNNSTTDSSAPVLVTQSGVLAGKTIISVAAGTAHSLALCSDGTLAAWGWNISGQLGNDTTTDSLVPVLVNQSGVLAGKTVVSISASQNFSLALCSDGTLAAWGGYSPTMSSSVPVAVTQSGVLAGKKVGAVSAGGSSGIALAAVPITSNQLSNLTLSSGTLSPAFDPATIAYTASVLYATSSITVTPTTAANVASVSVNGTSVTTGSMSQAFPLVVGPNAITAVVTGPDGVTTKTYTVTVTRAAPPVVTNISATQRAGTRLVDITYDMSSDFPTVWVGLEISMDGGATYSVPTTTLSGAVGAGVAPGTGRVITWDAGADWNGQYTSLMRFKVTAIDTLSNFSLIPQGSFQMGNAMAADTDITDAPIRTVNVSAFYMARNLVTKSDWDTVRTWGLAHGYTDLAIGAGKATNHPVQTITWYDTVKWCNARSEMEGLTPCYYTDAAQTVVYRTGNADLASTMVKWAANGYRLPTVAEWEKAARGGLSGKRFPWGDTISESQANYYGNTGNSYDLGPNGHNSIGSIGGTDPYTSPVGSFPANGYGLYDMAGNVFKWCWDWYGPYAAGAQTDPRGAATGNARVILGGDWSYGADYCRVAYRSPFNPPTNSQYNTGFRVARSVVMPDPAVFSLIPAGSFQMGNAMAADTDITDAPIRTVTTSAFYMARNLVTKAAWDTVRTWGLANGYTDLSTGAGKATNHPVQTLTWYDMVKWCNARSEMEGLTPCYILGGAVYRTNSDDAVVCNWAVSGYRMPSEAEWEKAARGGLSGKRFPWGDTISQSQANYQGLTSSYSYDLGPNGTSPIGSIGGNPQTSPVSSFPANGYGLYEMAGNVFEWCWDWYSAYAAGAQTDPQGVSSGALRVTRGGSWNYYADYCRVAYRGHCSPTRTYDFIGFRVARSMLADSVVAIASNASIDTRSTVATLSGLTLSAGTLSPAFVAATTSYTASVPNATTSITVTPTVTDTTATMKVNGTTVASGVASQSIPLIAGGNAITTVVTAQDGVTLTTYTVTVTRAGSYDSWKSTAFTNPTDLANPAISGEMATPANDGTSNLMKYAMALSPMASATGNLPTTASQAGYLTLTYRQSKTANDVSYTVQTTDTLSSNAWAPAATVLAQTDPTPGGGTYWLVTVRDNVPSDPSHPQRFMRLQVVK